MLQYYIVITPLKGSNTKTKLQNKKQNHEIPSLDYGLTDGLGDVHNATPKDSAVSIEPALP